MEELARTIAQLQKKLEQNECNHSHLFTEEWGGLPLIATMLDTEKEKGGVQVHHLQLFAWTDEWKTKHNL